MKVVAPMAGITNANFLIKAIPYGFNMLTLGGYNLDEATYNAAIEVSKRRKEFLFPLNKVFDEIYTEVFKIKSFKKDILVSANLRSTSPKAIVKISKIPQLDVVEINCHCRQEEFLDIGCGQNMLKRPDLADFIEYVVKKSKSKVSVKLRANVPGIDTLEICKEISSLGVDYLHIDAMKVGVLDADYELLSKIVSSVDTFVIGNNSINSSNQLSKMLETGVQGFSIGRALLPSGLDFKI